MKNKRRNIGSWMWLAGRSALRVGWLLPRKAISGAISIYQNTLSPDHGPLKDTHPYGFCRHEPTCSAYSKQVMLDRGVLIGSFLTLKRVLCCNPWVDPSPQRLRKAIEKV
ncbi:MAG: membrane protein insertion efficiency factor YidD [Candidatus Peribacteraceae bacterium]|jgi:hypothetical protein|nr:membrane protein insertion efficiency factor YidD [Candidatus Peribacteraceae bacterium]